MMVAAFRNFAIYLLVSVFILLLFFPLYIMFKISISVPSEIFQDKPAYLISQPTLEHFKDVFNSGRAFFLPFKKSIICALLATILSLFICLPAAYCLSKFKISLRYMALLCLFIGRMLPEVNIALSVSVNFIRLGLFDTAFGLTLAHMIRILPVCCFILVGVFSSFPQELEKQAHIDGCSRLKALTKVVIPLSLPGITVALIFSFLLSWDEFIYASYLSLAEPTMPLKMYYYVSRGDIFYSATYAVIITIPVLLFTFMMQRHIKPEYLAGAMKG